MTQPNFNRIHSSASSSQSFIAQTENTSIRGPHIETREAITQVAHSSLPKRRATETAHRPTRRRICLATDEQNGMKERVREWLGIEVEEEVQQKKQMIQHLREWTADSSIATDTRVARLQVLEEVIKWSVSPKDALSVAWNVLPNIFHMPFMQSNLRHLLIQCSADQLPEQGANLLELPELAGNLKKLKGLYIYGEGCTYLSDSIGSLRCLKRFDMIFTNITELPESIGDLIHIRSIKLLNNFELTSLPRSIVRLKELRFLSLDTCTKLSYLPDAHHCRSPQDRSDDESYRFSNLARLTSLSLENCHALETLPASLCKLKRIESLNFENCHNLTELPVHIGMLTRLHTLNIVGTQVAYLPVSLYRLALTKHEGFIASPWDEYITWMRQAIRGQHTPYVIDRQSDELQIRIAPQTMIPFAQEHLRLLVQTLERHGLTSPPKKIFVRYEGESGIDQGGLKRHFLSTLFSNLALQAKDDNNPIFKFSEEKGYYILERQLGTTSTPEEIEMCENIGKLLCALLCGLAEECKIGNVFPEHFYAYLFAMGFVKKIMLRPKSALQITDVRKRLFSRTLAALDKDGIKDREGVLLFQEKYFHTIRMPDSDLYKLWMLLICVADKEELEETFPSMAAKQFIFDDPANEVVDKKALVKAFKNDLNRVDAIGYVEFFIQTTLTKYVEDGYVRQCEALGLVIRGFQCASNKDQLKQIFERYEENNLANSAAKLALYVQGPPFTTTAFHQLVNRCFFDPSVPAQMRQLIETRVTLILNWYLQQPSSQESEGHMKRLVSCMTGSEVIMPDRELLFCGPRVRENGELEPRSIFHTCSGLVELGQALFAQEVVTPAGKEKIIEIWLNHITEALGAGFSLA